MHKAARALVLTGAAVSMFAVSAAPANAGTAAYTNVRLQKVWSAKNLCLSVNGKTGNNAPVMQSRCSTAADQKWTLKGNSQGVYTIKNKRSGKCMGISSTSNGAAITQRPCNASTKTQQWVLSGSRIISKWAGKCLISRNDTSGTKSVISKCGNRKAEEWGTS
ncbi:RICIN domain-containing protein [Streptomyces sp. NPDC019890]|uniref:RICIN domain-containing protein n=1 Tax=Streptomyces sp. NPDC019890 TaxID=3365064 RepID=UPI00384E1FE1